MHNQGQQYAFRSGYLSTPSQPSQRPSPQPSGSAYTPTSFDGPNEQGIPPEQYYGSFLDAYGKPTEVFCRLVDALFFHIDQNCDVPGLGGTGIIEPSKYVWMSIKMGAAEQSAGIMLQHLQSFYETAGIPFQFSRASNGQQIAVLDRRAFLHCAVFEVKAVPEEAYKHWGRAITLFGLRDPMHNLPFPTPLPRSALPYIPDIALSAAYSRWRTQIMVSTVRAQSQARMAAMVAGYRRQSAFGGFGQPSMGGLSYMGGVPGVGMGLGAGVGINPALGGGSGGSNSGDHSTWKDTATAVATLANTVIGVATGTGGVGSFGATGFGS